MTDPPAGDGLIRPPIGNLPVPEFAETAWTVPPPLAEARVAVVTSAALYPCDGEPFTVTDTSYRALDHDQRQLVMGHWSPNFDRSAFGIDYNVVYPLARLDELAEQGVIGSVASKHYAFAGNQPDDVATIRYDSGPACAAELKADGVDVVFLTPV
ncbi:MAG: selenoprotein B glycine/betaine/sarcosine/D-proline reductase [Chloroflexi bacterium]|nr:selenoprotein B glycine/betaine/sarcosine/D-proline reductase [Chloroflexota bacterium]